MVRGKQPVLDQAFKCQEERSGGIKCPSTFKTLAELKKHVRTCHRHVICGVCQRKFTLDSFRFSHVKRFKKCTAQLPIPCTPSGTLPGNWTLHPDIVRKLQADANRVTSAVNATTEGQIVTLVDDPNLIIPGNVYYVSVTEGPTLQQSFTPENDFATSDLIGSSSSIGQDNESEPSALPLSTDETNNDALRNLAEHPQSTEGRDDMFEGDNASYHDDTMELEVTLPSEVAEARLMTHYSKECSREILDMEFAAGVLTNFKLAHLEYVRTNGDCALLNLPKESTKSNSLNEDRFEFAVTYGAGKTPIIRSFFIDSAELASKLGITPSCYDHRIEEIRQALKLNTYGIAEVQTFWDLLVNNDRQDEWDETRDLKQVVELCVTFQVKSILLFLFGKENPTTPRMMKNSMDIYLMTNDGSGLSNLCRLLIQYPDLITDLTKETLIEVFHRDDLEIPEVLIYRLAVNFASIGHVVDKTMDHIPEEVALKFNKLCNTIRFGIIPLASFDEMIYREPFLDPIKAAILRHNIYCKCEGKPARFLTCAGDDPKQYLPRLAVSES